jgi:hypothetical protein
MNLTELNDLRQRVLLGEEVPAEELRAALDTLRSGRRSAAIAGATKAAKTAVENAPKIDIDAIMAKIIAKRTAS